MKQNSIAKNTAFITTALILQKVIAFVYFTLIARNIGAEGTGKYFFAMSFTTVFVVFIDLGLTQVLIREGAKAREKLQKFFSSVIFTKIFFGIITYIATVITINALGYPVETKQLVYLSAVTMVFDSIHLTIYGVMRAIGNLKYEAYAITLSQFATLILGSIFLYTGKPLIFLILAFTIPSFLNVCYASLVLFKKYKISLRPVWDKEVLIFFAKIAVPFALTAIFSRIYSYVDSIILSKLVGDAQVGWYSVPYKITFSFQFIPLALVASLYPKFSEYFVSDKKWLVHIFEQGVKYLLIMVFPVVVGISILSKDIILSIYTTEYINSILPLQILLGGLVFSYMAFPIGSFLNACNKQTIQTVIVFVIMVINIILNFIFIPRYGVVGAAISSFVSNFLLAGWGYIIILKTVKVSHWFFVKTIFKLSMASLVMGIVVWQTNVYYHYIWAILIGILIYPVMLFVTRVVTREQIKEMLVLIKR